MNDYIGQNPDEVDRLAAELGQRATEIVDLQRAVTNRLAASVWTGPDRERFEADWQSTTAQFITQVVDALRAAAQAAAGSAQGQRSVSGAA